MGERACELQTSYARVEQPAPAERSAPPRTPAEHAREVLAMLARENGDLRMTVGEVRAARTANDLERWTQARRGVEKRFATVERSLERARTASIALPEIAEQVAIVARDLEQLRDDFAALGDAPTGFTTIADEAAILATIEAPLEGGFRIGFEKKEVALKTRFDRLTPGDRDVLAERLRRQRPNDPLSVAFGRFTAARRQSLLGHLVSSRQRDAQIHNTTSDRV